MAGIPIEKVNGIKDLDSLIGFLRDELDWPIRQDAFIDDITYEWTGTELNLSETRQKQLKHGCIRQLRKLHKDQPLAIFLVDFQSKHLYTTTLRQILRHFAIKKRQARPDTPAWAPENMLFVCTTDDYKEFTYTHFYGDKPDRARMTSFSWSPGEPMRTVCEYNLPALRYDPELDKDNWQRQWLSAFDVEKVTRQFFADYKQVFESLQNLLIKQLWNID